MNSRLLLWLGILFAFPAHADNLVMNGSDEAALVDGLIPGWTDVVGAHWGQRSANPPAYDGTYYFFEGTDPSGTLQQVVDVSSYEGTIDQSRQNFDFSGYVRSYPQTPSDTSEITVQFLDAGQAPLLTLDSGQISNTTDWQQVAFSHIAPIGTRSIAIVLTAIRYNGTNNDGYFDDISLNTETLPVPEPGTSALLGVGLGGWLLVRRRQGRRLG